MQAEARDSGVYLSQTQLRGNVSLPLVPRGALMSATTARDETESVWLSLSPLFLTAQVLQPPPRPAGGCCHHNVSRKCFPFYVLTQPLLVLLLYTLHIAGSWDLELWRKLEILRRTCGW